MTEEQVVELLKVATESERDKHKKVLSNEEWFMGLSTKEKSKVLNNIFWNTFVKQKSDDSFEANPRFFEKWLREVHGK